MAELSEIVRTSNTAPSRRSYTVVQQVSGNSLQNQLPSSQSDNNFVEVQNCYMPTHSSPPGMMVEQNNGDIVLIPKTMTYDFTTEVSGSNDSNLESASIISHSSNCSSLCYYYYQDQGADESAYAGDNNYAQGSVTVAACDRRAVEDNHSGKPIFLEKGLFAG